MSITYILPCAIRLLWNCDNYTTYQAGKRCQQTYPAFVAIRLFEHMNTLQFGTNLQTTRVILQGAGPAPQRKTTNEMPFLQKSANRCPQITNGTVDQKNERPVNTQFPTETVDPRHEYGSTDGGANCGFGSRTQGMYYSCYMLMRSYPRGVHRLLHGPRLVPTSATPRLYLAS